MRYYSILLSVLILSLSSCFSISKSSLREPVPNVIEINDCKISSSGAVFLKIFGYIRTDFVPASVKIDYNGIIIYCDPLVVEDTAKADYIFITHSHLDHFSKSDIQKLIKPETVIIAPSGIVKTYKQLKNYTAKIGITENLSKIQYEAVASYNLKSKMHKKGDDYVGYVITCGKTRIYIAGDTDFIPEMSGLKDITVAIVPIGEGKTAMNPASAAEAVNLIKPDLVIPVHYELNKNRENEFMEKVDVIIKVYLFNII